MPAAGPLDRLPLWLLLAITIIVLLVSVETGYQLGRYRLRRPEQENEAYVRTLVTATMGLMAFVLAFTFGMAATRFETRKQVVVDEANAVGTTYLRAGLLPGDRGAKVRALLREYVELRLEAVAIPDNLERVVERSEEIHRELWREAEAAGRDNLDSHVVGLFIESLNKTIELHATRVKVAIRGRIPGVLWTALFADLDRPQEGTLTVSQQAMIDLRRTMGE